MSGLQDHANSVMTELPKLAIWYPGTVLRSLLTLCEVDCYNKNGNPELKELTWSHWRQYYVHSNTFLLDMVRVLRFLSSYCSLFQERRRGASPILASPENSQTIRGDIESHQHHLRAARPLLSALLSPSFYQGDVSTIECLEEYYTYVFCVNDLTATLILLSETLLGCVYDFFGLAP